MPRREHEEDRESDEHEERGEEAQPGARLLALASHTRISARTVIVVGPVDRRGVERWFLRRRGDSAGGLSHAGSLVPLWPEFGGSTILFNRVGL